MAQLPTVSDVARLANVSRQTVSNVLNSPSIVRADTRARVEAAIRELNYRPHASARRLRSRKSFTIGVRLEPIRNGISGSVLDAYLHALTEQADERGMRILLYTAKDHRSEIEQIERLRDGADIDAFVLTSTQHDDPRVEWLLDNDVAFATFGRPWGATNLADPRHPWVDVDGRTGVRTATEFLFSEGARRVGYIGWSGQSGAGDERRGGWSDALAAVGIAEDSLSIATDDGVSQGTSAAIALLDGADAPDALVCASDSLALGASMATTVRGLSVPIVGYDNTAVAAAVGLSSVEQPLAEVAAGVLELLFGPTGNDLVDRSGQNEEPNNRLLVPRLVVRRSTHLAPDESTGAVGAGNHNRKESL